MLKKTNIPIVLKIKLIIAKIGGFMSVNPASIVTPASSGNGDAIIIPANAYIR